MAYIFMSHASIDKEIFVRPLVEVLVEEGEPVWIDRPGVGPGCLGLDQAYISRNDIDYLASGHSWSESIQSALRHSGAVLGCISRSLLGDRDVLIGELTVASAMGKLITCIVDDLDFNELPGFSTGLLDTGRLQAPQISPQRLRLALDYRKKNQCAVESLPAELGQEWERVRNLIASIDHVRTEPRRLRPKDYENIIPRLRRMPIGPVLKISSVPMELVHSLGDNVNRPERVLNLIHQANELIASSGADPELTKKLQIRTGSLPPIGGTSGDNFWTQAFCQAGLRARRTVAALVMNPVAHWAFRLSEAEETAQSFLRWLETSGKTTT